MAPLTDKTADSWRELRTVTPIRRLFAHLIDQCLWVGAAYWQFTSFSKIDSTGPGSPAVYGQVLASAFAMVFLLAVYVILAKAAPAAMGADLGEESTGAEAEAGA